MSMALALARPSHPAKDIGCVKTAPFLKLKIVFLSQRLGSEHDCALFTRVKKWNRFWVQKKSSFFGKKNLLLF
jgi:hypothetical protein